MAAGIHYRLDWNVLDSYFQFQELAAAPGTPEADNLRLYAKDDGAGVSTLCYKNDAGAVVCFPVAAGTLVTGTGVATRVAFWDAASNLTSDADMTFVTDTLTVAKLIGSTSITDSGLTVGRVTFAGTAGLLSDSALFTFTDNTGGNQAAVIVLGSNSVVGVINCQQGLSFNIDSDNNHADTLFIIQANTTLRESGGLRLLTINETGSIGVGDPAGYGTSLQALLSAGNAAAPAWTSLDHGTHLAGLADDDHALYLLASDATNRATFATNWLDLTDGGASTLHSHAGGSGLTQPEILARISMRG